MDRLSWPAWIALLQSAADRATAAHPAAAFTRWLRESLQATQPGDWQAFGNGWSWRDEAALRSQAGAAWKAVAKPAQAAEWLAAFEVLVALACEGREGPLKQALLADAQRLDAEASGFGRRSAAGQARADVVERCTLWLDAGSRGKLVLDGGQVRAVLGGLLAGCRFYDGKPLEPVELPVKRVLQLCAKQAPAALTAHIELLQDLKRAIQRVPAAASAEARERVHWVALVDQLAAVPGADPPAE